MIDWTNDTKILSSKPKNSQFSIHTDLKHDIALADKQKCITQLAHFGAIYITGADANKFLQGQLTCDMQQLTTTQALPAAYCNAQGRVIAIFLVVYWQDGILLIMPHEIITTTCEILKKYAIFSKVNICDFSSQLTIFGAINLTLATDANYVHNLPTNNYQVIQNNHRLLIKFLGNNFLIIVSNANIAAVWPEIKDDLNLVGSIAWHYQQLKQGFPNIYATTQEKLLPHRINLPNLDIINFKKGCYVGQEIIARTHYKATLKHALYLYLITGQTSVNPGDIIDSSNGVNKIGQIIDCCPISNNSQLVLASILIEWQGLDKWQVHDIEYAVSLA